MLPFWLHYALFLLAATLLAALFLLLAMGVSVLARNSSSSLVFLVTAWTVLIVVIPQTSYLIATQTVDSVGYGRQAFEAINNTWEEAQTALEREGSMPRDPTLAKLDNYAAEKRYIRRMHKVDKEVNQLRKQIEQQRQHQFKRAMAINLLSPGYAFQYTVEAALGAGVQYVEHFNQQGGRYRAHLQQFLQARDKADPDSPHIHFLPNFMSQKELDGALIPRFQNSPVPPRDPGRQWDGAPASTGIRDDLGVLLCVVGVQQGRNSRGRVMGGYKCPSILPSFVLGPKGKER